MRDGCNKRRKRAFACSQVWTGCAHAPGYTSRFSFYTDAFQGMAKRKGKAVPKSPTSPAKNVGMIDGKKY